MNSSFMSDYNAYTFPQTINYPQYQNFYMVPMLQPTYYSQPIMMIPCFDLNSQQSHNQTQMAKYQPRAVSNVIIQEESQPEPQNDNKQRNYTKNPAKAGEKPPKVQKENRNVASNLFRVLLKNILEVHLYDKMIERIILKLSLGVSGDQFLSWLASFKINYRNYIKPREINKISRTKHCEEHQLIYRVILRQFMTQMGVLHCLTSKRLDGQCCKRHIRGLRTLIQYGSEENLE